MENNKLLRHYFILHTFIASGFLPLSPGLREAGQLEQSARAVQPGAADALAGPRRNAHGRSVHWAANKRFEISKFK